MTTKTGKKSRRVVLGRMHDRRRLIADYLPVWVLLGIILAILLPELLTWGLNAGVDLAHEAPGLVVDVGEGVLDAAGDGLSWVYNGIKNLVSSDDTDTIAPLFTDEVQYWRDSIRDWADDHDLDPNLLASVLQIESCGYASSRSISNAQGLFQVMPMHFAVEENQLDPNTNAQRGIQVLADCLRRSEGNVGLAMACYNGGPSVISAHYDTWVAETQRYFQWGTGIYADAQKNRERSATLTEWLEAGGASLCQLASEVQKSD